MIAPVAPVDSAARQPRRGFPATSTLGLVMLAAVAWTLAVWNDSLRLARSRRPDRLAHQPPAAAAPRDTISP